MVTGQFAKYNQSRRCRKSTAIGTHRQGSIFIWSIFLIPVLMALISLAVDFAHVQLIKTEMQRDADATARGTLQMYVNDGLATAQAIGPVMATNTYNPVDGNSGIQPTVTLIWGWWNSTTKTFVAGSGSPMAVRVTISRTSQNGNSVPLTFPVMDGLSSIRTTCDVSATATAVLDLPQTSISTVKGTADVWLSGMPAGSNAGWSDSPANAPPVLAMNVTQGAVMTFGATGATMYNGSMSTISADGAAWSSAHMQGSPDGNYNGLQNGIQTITAPQNALIGVFLNDNQPNTQTPPAAGLDYSSSNSQNQVNFTSAALQQPFFIGDGKATAGTTQSFVVPPGATRLYLGVFDGWQNNDNPGFLSVVVNQHARVYLVK